MNVLAVGCDGLGILGEDVEIGIVAYDETNSRIRPHKIIADI